jgi:hypothetical protein
VTLRGSVLITSVCGHDRSSTGKFEFHRTDVRFYPDHNPRLLQIQFANPWHARAINSNKVIIQGWVYHVVDAIPINIECSRDVVITFLHEKAVSIAIVRLMKDRTETLDRAWGAGGKQPRSLKDLPIWDENIPTSIDNVGVKGLGGTDSETQVTVKFRINGITIHDTHSSDVYNIDGGDITACHIEVPSVELEVSWLSKPAHLGSGPGPVNLVLTPQNMTHVPKTRCLLGFYLQHKEPVGDSELSGTGMQNEQKAEDETLSQDHESQSEATTPSPTVALSSTTETVDKFTAPESAADVTSVTSGALDDSRSITGEAAPRRSPANTPINEENNEEPLVASHHPNDHHPSARELATSSYSVLVGPDPFTDGELYFTPTDVTFVLSDWNVWYMNYKDIDIEVENLTVHIHGFASRSTNKNTWEARFSVKTTVLEVAQSIAYSFHGHGVSVGVAGLLSSNANPMSPPNKDQSAISPPGSAGHIPDATSALGSTLYANLEIGGVPWGKSQCTSMRMICF